MRAGQTVVYQGKPATVFEVVGSGPDGFKVLDLVVGDVIHRGVQHGEWLLPSEVIVKVVESYRRRRVEPDAGTPRPEKDPT